MKAHEFLAAFSQALADVEPDAEVIVAGRERQENILRIETGQDDEGMFIVFLTDGD